MEFTSNITRNDKSEEFICEKCNIRIADFVRLIDEQDIPEEYEPDIQYEFSYDIKYCPECGRKVIEK